MTDWTQHLQRRIDIKGGRPCLRGTGVPVEIVVERFAAGENVRYLGADYGVHDVQVIAALRFVLTVRGSSLNSLRARRTIDRLLPMEPA